MQGNVVNGKKVIKEVIQDAHDLELAAPNNICRYENAKFEKYGM